MTVGYITRNYPPYTEGGAEISLQLLANSLAKKGINIRIFLPDDQTKKLDISGENPKVYRFPWLSKRPFFLNNPSAQKTFRDSIYDTKEKLDIIDAYNFITTLPTISKELNIPYVVSLRDATPICDVRCELFPKYHPFLDYFKLRFGYLGASPLQAAYGFLGYFLTQKRLEVIKKANCVTVCSKALLEVYREYNKNIQVIHSVASIEKTPEEKISLKNIEFKKDKVFLYAGRLTYGKGAKFLFQAAEEIAKKRKDIKFIFVGKGEYYQEFLKTEYKNSITVLNRQSREFTLSLMAKSRSVIVPSIIFEPFPRVALESLSCNTPVIGTKSGGIPEAIGRAGIITNINKNDMIKAIIKMSDDEHFYKEKKKLTKNQVKKFDKDIISDKVLSIYKRIIK